MREGRTHKTPHAQQRGENHLPLYRAPPGIQVPHNENREGGQCNVGEGRYDAVSYGCKWNYFKAEAGSSSVSTWLWPSLEDRGSIPVSPAPAQNLIIEIRRRSALKQDDEEEWDRENPYEHEIDIDNDLVQWCDEDAFEQKYSDGGADKGREEGVNDLAEEPDLEGGALGLERIDIGLAARRHDAVYGQASLDGVDSLGVVPVRASENAGKGPPRYVRQTQTSTSRVAASSCWPRILQKRGKR